MHQRLLIILAVLALTGCATQTYQINGDTTVQPTLDKSQTFFLHGIGQQQSMNAADICGGADKVIKVESQESFVNILLRMITFGIYTPRQSKVYCKTEA